MPWGQFIAIDMQMFLFLPVILLIYQYSKGIAIFLLTVSIICGAVASGLIKWLNNFLPGYLWPLDTKVIQEYAFLTQTHVEAYSIGILMGLVYHKIHWYNNQAT
jgi:hypothetical protein